MEEESMREFRTGFECECGALYEDGGKHFFVFSCYPLRGELPGGCCPECGALKEKMARVSMEITLTRQVQQRKWLPDYKGPWDPSGVKILDRLQSH